VTNKSNHDFSEIIEIIGVNPYVSLPEALLHLILKRQEKKKERFL